MKLFRKLRQDLLQEGKLKKYLIYAVGEILLVMIGILLALQINNWNQQRINHTKEIKALADLSKEFKLNRDRIIAKQNLRISITPKLENYISFISKDKANYSSFKDFHSTQFMFGMTNPSKGVIDALISSGEISLISNDSLKYFLADWKYQLENLLENEEILWAAGLELIKSTSDKIPNPNHNWADWNLNKLKSTSDDLISNIQYRNNLVDFEGCNKIVVQECNIILKVLEEISSILDSEITKRK